MKKTRVILYTVFTAKLLASCLSKAPNEKTKVIEQSTFEEVRIGEQIWMAENLDIATFRNGDKIREVKNDLEWREAADKMEPACCYFKFSEKKYGRYYNWWAVIDERGLAPEGWHIPNREEYLDLINELGGGNDLSKASDDVFFKVGLKLKSKSDDWIDNIGRNGSGNNSSGFSALPNTQLDNGGYWSDENTAWFWTSTRYPYGRGISAYSIIIHGQRGGGQGVSDEVYISSCNKGNGIAVRCVKD